MKLKRIYTSLLIPAVVLANCPDGYGDIENIETFCNGEEIKIILTDCIIQQYGIYGPEFYLSGNGKFLGKF